MQLKRSAVFQDIYGRLIAKMSPVFCHFAYVYHWPCGLAAHLINRWDLSPLLLNLGQPCDCFGRQNGI